MKQFKIMVLLAALAAPMLCTSCSEDTENIKPTPKKTGVVMAPETVGTGGAGGDFID